MSCSARAPSLAGIPLYSMHTMRSGSDGVTNKCVMRIVREQGAGAVGRRRSNGNLILDHIRLHRYVLVRHYHVSEKFNAPSSLTFYDCHSYNLTVQLVPASPQRKHMRLDSHQRTASNGWSPSLPRMSAWNQVKQGTSESISAQQDQAHRCPLPALIGSASNFHQPVLSLSAHIKQILQVGVL
jgi:hypothetical protein